MAMRMAALRQVMARRFSSGGKVLSEEEKAAENIYIKKVEQEKLEKAARKGPSSGGDSAADVKPSTSTSSSSGHGASNVSTDKNKNYAIVAGAITAIAALGWYLKSPKKSAEVQE